MSDAKNEIDVILPRNLEHEIAETSAGLDLVKAASNYFISSFRRPSDWRDLNDFNGFFDCLEVKESNCRLDELWEMLRHSYWGVERLGEDYFRRIPFRVLLSFAYRLDRLLFYQHDDRQFFDVDLGPTELIGGINFGMERRRRKVKIWFVKYGVGRFALDLADISEETARSLRFLGGGRIRYEHGEEVEALEAVDIYPMADVAENRRNHRTECFFANGKSENTLPSTQELEAQWKINDVNCLPTKLIKVNLIQAPSNTSTPSGTYNDLGWLLESGAGHDEGDLIPRVRETFA